MTYVSKNTFVKQLLLPSGAPITSDPRQFSGQLIKANLANACPQPFTSNTGLAYCPALCINTCPELNPNVQQMIQQQVTTYILLKSYVYLALANAQNSLNQQTKSITVTGPVTFSIPAGTNASVVTSVISSITTQFPVTVSSQYILTITVCVMNGFWDLVCQS
jgi:hypothetical protein